MAATATTLADAAALHGRLMRAAITAIDAALLSAPIPPAGNTIAAKAARASFKPSIVAAAARRPITARLKQASEIIDAAEARLDQFEAAAAHIRSGAPMPNGIDPLIDFHACTARAGVVAGSITVDAAAGPIEQAVERGRRAIAGMRDNHERLKGTAGVALARQTASFYARCAAIAGPHAKQARVLHAEFERQATVKSQEYKARWLADRQPRRAGSIRGTAALAAAKAAAAGATAIATNATEAA